MSYTAIHYIQFIETDRKDKLSTHGLKLIAEEYRKMEMEIALFKDYMNMKRPLAKSFTPKEHLRGDYANALDKYIDVELHKVLNKISKFIPTSIANSVSNFFKNKAIEYDTKFNYLKIEMVNDNVYLVKHKPTMKSVILEHLNKNNYESKNI